MTATDTTTPANGGQTASGSSSPITVSGLTNGDAYTFTVTATNGVGDGAASSATSAVTPSDVPDAPTGVSATAGNQSASVSWTAANSEGSAITSYTVTSNHGQTCSTATTSCTVSGLTNGTAYTFTVTATNGNGTSSASAASNPVVPATVPDAPTAVSATAGNGTASVSFTAPASTRLGHHQLHGDGNGHHHAGQRRPDRLGLLESDHGQRPHQR